MTAKPGKALIEVTLTDRDGQTATASRRVGVVADRRSPAVTRVYPPDGTVLFAGRERDGRNRGVGRRPRGRSCHHRRHVREHVFAGPPYALEVKAPVVNEVLALPLVLQVFDAAGNVVDENG